MTPAEQEAICDLMRNARELRLAASRLPELRSGEAVRRSARFRLELGALDCEKVAAFIYWRNEGRAAARTASSISRP